MAKRMKTWDNMILGCRQMWALMKKEDIENYTELEEIKESVADGMGVKWDSYCVRCEMHRTHGDDCGCANCDLLKLWGGMRKDGKYPCVFNKNPYTRGEEAVLGEEDEEFQLCCQEVVDACDEVLKDNSKLYLREMNAC